MSDLIQRLRERAAQLNEADRPLSDATLAANEIERCHARLEIDHLFKMKKGEEEMVREEVPYAERATLPDGIDCRDETIKIQDKNVDTLRAKVAALEAVLDPFVKHAHCVNEIQLSSLALWCAQALNAVSEKG